LEYFGDDCLDLFVTQILNRNNGNAICLAHNGSGYDTRLVFNALIAKENHPALNPVINGGKFMRLRVGTKLMFRDSMLHCRGSLKKLAIDFCGSSALKKGFFPQHSILLQEPFPYNRYESYLRLTHPLHGGS
jgi:hypothetical protein